MGDYKEIIVDMKSELLNLSNEVTEEKTYAEWFEVFRLKLHDYFGIEQSDFFMYSNINDSFVSIQKDNFHVEQGEPVPYELIANASKAFQIQAFKERKFEYAHDCIHFKDETLKSLGILLVDDAVGWREFSESAYVNELEIMMGNFIKNIRKVKMLMKEEQKYRNLFNMTEFFNATMESHVILDGIINEVQKTFPAVSVELLLAKEQEGLTYTYRQFDHMTERAKTIEAFLSGEITVEEAEDLKVELINIPIKGRQGIYGLLQIKNPQMLSFTEAQKNFIWMLASAAGNALENASLYDQSHRLIEELRLVNETSHELNSGMQFNEMILFLKKQLLSALAADEVGFAFMNERNEQPVIEASTPFLKTAEGERYTRYIHNHLSDGKLALFEADLAETANKQVSFKSIIGLPILNEDKMIGFVICLQREEYFFSFDKFKLMQSLIGHASLAISNLLLRNQLKELAEKDHLTGLYARRYLDNLVQDDVSKESGGVFALLDIDDFKQINDSYGHDVGDRVLKQVSSFILEQIQSDGVAARWGGEEIAIYLPDVDEEQGRVFTEQLIRGIPTVTTPSVTVSAGMTNWFAGDQVALNKLLKLTDTVLYEAKRRGKNRLIVYEMDEVFE